MKLLLAMTTAIVDLYSARAWLINSDPIVFGVLVEHNKQKKQLVDKWRCKIFVQPRKVSTSQRDLRCFCWRTTRCNKATGAAGLLLRLRG